MIQLEWPVIALWAYASTVDILLAFFTYSLETPGSHSRFGDDVRREYEGATYYDQIDLFEKLKGPYFAALIGSRHTTLM